MRWRDCRAGEGETRRGGCGRVLRGDERRLAGVEARDVVGRAFVQQRVQKSRCRGRTLCSISLYQLYIPLLFFFLLGSLVRVIVRRRGSLCSKQRAVGEKVARRACAARAVFTGIALDTLLATLAWVSSLGTRAGWVVHIGGRVVVVVGRASGGIEVQIIVVLLEGGV